ncbi:MAG: TrkA family potassium uptake protein [Dehalococcoidia bacterium]|nr:TrkA family potassium uptake protein [Dehalococcoidia bacterium]
MYIVIVGGGMVGYYLCKALLAEGHEVMVIEKERRRYQRGEEELGSVFMLGDGCEAEVLAEAGVERADIFIAATDQDEDNLVACQVAKYRFNVPKTIARINNPRNERIFKQLGIDRTVSQVKHMLEDIEEQIPTHIMARLFTLADVGLEIVELKVPADSPVVGRQVSELALPEDSVLSLLLRNGERPRVPSLDTVILPGDRIIALTSAESESVLQGLFSPRYYGGKSG